MARRRLILSVFSVAIGFALGACKTTQSGSTAKDDFVSAGAAEFTVSGSDTVTLEPEYATKTDAEKMQRAAQLASYRDRAIGFFLKTYIEDKEEGDANFNYGKFNGEVRFGTDTSSSVALQSGLTYSFNYTFQIAGYSDMQQRINKDQGRDLNAAQMTIQTADLSNTLMANLKVDNEWYRDEPYQSFNPNTYTQPKRALTATIVQQSIDTDAYLPFAQLAASGTIAIAAHYGWDGETPPGPGGVRNDVILARALYDEFVSEGFTPPAASSAAYAPYDPNTAPLKKMIKVNGKPVEIDVYIYFAGQPAANVPGPDPETTAGAKVLLAQLVNSFATKQVISYLGHSGIGAGFNMSDWDKAEGGTLTRRWWRRCRCCRPISWSSSTVVRPTTWRIGSGRIRPNPTISTST